MDISEYEIIMENKKLLEESIQRERSLNDKIEELNKEKIKALEDAKMKVIKIEKTEMTEWTLNLKDDLSIWRELWRFATNGNQIPNMPDYIRFGRISDMFFEKTKSISFPKEEITTVGLDEIKKEISDDLKSKLDSKTISQLSKAELTLSENDRLLKENKILQDDVDFKKEINQKLENRLEGQEKKIEDLLKILKESEESNKSLSEIKKILINGYGFWNRGEIIKKIYDIVWKKSK